METGNGGFKSAEPTPQHLHASGQPILQDKPFCRLSLFVAFKRPPFGSFPLVARSPSGFCLKKWLAGYSPIATEILAAAVIVRL
jgi:hypothetical protein